VVDAIKALLLIITDLRKQIWFANVMDKTTSLSLYYRKPEASSPKGYLPMADVYSNGDAVSNNRFAKANLVCECNEQNNIS